ncbi:acyl-CoA thioesterase [candidate division KSB1 bacterium]|nr:acyl-CoA thioesterase [candidate division KSB1 bacterium]
MSGNISYLTAYHTVRSYELDSFGHVNNAVFLNYLEYARTEYLLQRGLSFDDFEKWQKYPLVIKVDIEYKYPARVHDKLKLSGYISEWKKSSFTLKYRIDNLSKERLCATADVVFVFTNSQGRPSAIPEQFRSRME